MNPGLDAAEVEAFYDALAQALDRVGPEGETAFLCRLALLLAHRGGDLGAALAAIDSALDVDGPARTSGLA
jgi:hypothetical protein